MTTINIKTNTISKPNKVCFDESQNFIAKTGGIIYLVKVSQHDYRNNNNIFLSNVERIPLCKEEEFHLICAALESVVDCEDYNFGEI